MTSKFDARKHEDNHVLIHLGGDEPCVSSRTTLCHKLNGDPYVGTLEEMRVLAEELSAGFPKVTYLVCKLVPAGALVGTDEIEERHRANARESLDRLIQHFTNMRDSLPLPA